MEDKGRWEGMNNNMKLKDYYGSFLEYKRKEGCAEHTLGEYRRFIYGSLSHCALENKRIGQLRLTNVVDVMESGREHGEYGPQRSVSVFRQLMKYLEDSGQKLPFNWTRIKLPLVPEKEQDFLTPMEFENFVNLLPSNRFYGLRDRTIYEILWSSGMRIGELLALKKDDVDWHEKEAKIRTLKTGDENKVYFSDRCLEWLARYMKARDDTCPALFVVYNQGIRPLSGCQARKNLIGYRRKFGIKKLITHHAFRRSFCSLLLDKGATIKEVQTLARHRSERTTLHFYCKIEKLKVKAVHQAIFSPVEN